MANGFPQSITEQEVDAMLTHVGFAFEKHKPMPVTEWPWKTPRSKGPPKCDFYLPGQNIYIEVKGLMTPMMLAKSAWLCNQDFPYFFFQHTDETWEPFADSPCPLATVDRRSVASLLRSTSLQQLNELVWFSKDPSRLAEMNALTRARIVRHFRTEIKTFERWSGVTL